MVVAMAGLLVACGGGGEGGGGTPTVQALADKLGCTGLKIEAEDSQQELGAREEGSCAFAGDEVTLLTYNSNSTRDAMNKIAKDFGGIAVLGDQWTVRVGTNAIAEQVKAKLGGKID